MIQQEMLQYQKIDSELNRIERDLKKSTYFVQRKQFRAMRAELEDNLSKLDAKAADLRTQLAAAKANLQKIGDVIEEHSKELANVQDADEINYMSKKLNEQIEMLNTVERDIKRIIREGEEISKAFDDANAQLPKLVAGYNKCNEEINKATEAVKPRVLELRAQQAELKKAIDPQLFDIYKRVSDGQIHPVFVKLIGGNQCGGCRMEMPKAMVDTQMANKEYMRCEHCGRIIYKED